MLRVRCMPPLDSAASSSPPPAHRFVMTDACPAPDGEQPTTTDEMEVMRGHIPPKRR